jgi:hypothetical protein
MRFMQVIEATDVHDARRSYLELIQRRGIALVPNMAIYVETVHRSRHDADSWL